MAQKLGLEERVYRFRCVEAWSMIVPWTGYTLSKLLKQAEPKASAKYVKFYTAMKPAEMPDEGACLNILGHTLKACVLMKQCMI